MLARQPEARIPLDIPFKGERDYVRGADLFVALESVAKNSLAPSAYLKALNLRRLARSQVMAQFQPSADAFGTFTFALPRQTVEGWLVENGSPITRRTAHDESPILQQAIIEPGRVFLPSPVKPYSGFDQLIVLFKMLCAQSHPGSWLFTAIDLDCPLSSQAALAVSRTQLVLGRLVDAALYQDARMAGRLQMVLFTKGGAI